MKHVTVQLITVVATGYYDVTIVGFFFWILPAEECRWLWDLRSFIRRICYCITVFQQMNNILHLGDIIVHGTSSYYYSRRARNGARSGMMRGGRSNQRD